VRSWRDQALDHARTAGWLPADAETEETR